MCWTQRHDEILISEILLFEPWLQKKGTPERGAVWKRIAESLNQVSHPNFKVDDRSIRDHYRILEKKFIRKQNIEEKATGISPEEDSEIDRGLADAISQFKDYDLQHTQEKVKRDEEINKEQKTAEEFRRASLETFGETQTRTGSEEGTSKKKRKSGTEAIAYLREKSDKTISLRKEELALKKSEVEERQRTSDRMQEMLTSQQQQTSMILQQQQQVNNALIQFLNRFTPP